MTCPTCGDCKMVPMCYPTHDLDGDCACPANFYSCPDCADEVDYEEWTTLDDVFLVIACAMFILIVGGMVFILLPNLFDLGVRP